MTLPFISAVGPKSFGWVNGDEFGLHGVGHSCEGLGLGLEFGLHGVGHSCEGET